MEYFLGELLFALSAIGVETGVLVHSDTCTGGEEECCPDSGRDIPVWRVPTLGSLLYTPISPAFPSWLNRAITTLRPDILHLHLPNPSAFWVMACPSARRIPWVIHWHSDVVSSSIDCRLAIAYKIYRFFEQRLLAGSSRIVTTTTPYLEASEPLRRWRKKAVVIPLGMDINRLAKPSVDDLKWAAGIWGESSLKVLTVGRLTYYKGHEFLIRAMSDMEDASLVIVGDGDRREKLEAILHSLRPKCQINLVGNLTDSRRNALYSTCSCFCLPSIERTEAFGMVLLEAMCFKRALVVSDIAGSGVGWVVQENKTGLLVSPTAEKDLRAAIERMRDKVFSEKLGQAGFDRIHQTFDIHRVAQRVKDLYDEVG